MQNKGIQQKSEDVAQITQFLKFGDRSLHLKMFASDLFGDAEVCAG